MNRLAITVIVVVVFTVLAIAVNAFPWYLRSSSSAGWNTAMALTDDNILLDIKYAVAKDSMLTVILVHDYGQDKSIWSKIGLDKRLLNYDNAVVTFDLRFHGNSTPVLASGGGTFAVSSESDYVDDIITIIKWAEKNIGKPIVLIGYGEVSRAVLESVNKLEGANIRGVVLIAEKYKDVASLVSKVASKTNIMVLSNDPSWTKTSVYFVSIGVSGNEKILWNDNKLDLLFNWIKNKAFEK